MHYPFLMTLMGKNGVIRMHTMKLRLLPILALTFLLAGCGLSDQQKVDYAAVQRSGVSSAIYDKMMHGDPLSVNDVAALSRARVSDGVIIRYIRDHDTVYALTSADYDTLHAAGVSPSVVDFMTRVGPAGPYVPGPYYPAPPIAVGVGVGFGGHWH